jgi:multisubunit Na+/H+ antiporter MnhF subunit
MLWTALVALQSWSIHRGGRAVHKAAGRSSLFLFPLFWTSGLLIVQLMAAGFVARDNPFHTLFGARLAAVDIIGSAAILYLYWTAISRRRSTLVHAAAMLAILLFLLPPIFVRLLQIGGPQAIRGPDEFYKFGPDFDLCNLACILLALRLYALRPRTAWPFLVAAGAIALQTLAFETLGRMEAWAKACAAIAAIPTAGLAAGALALSAAVVWLAWTSPERTRRSGVEAPAGDVAITA